MSDDSARKFKFISPGVFINEVDNSQLPEEIGEIGPVIIGRSRKGPAMKPVTIRSFSDFVQTFGEPVAGPEAVDIAREGNLTSPTYGALAAQAYLANNAPLTFVRLVGVQNSSATSTGKAGYKAGVKTKSTTVNDGGAWGLVVFPSASLQSKSAVTGALAATFYLESGRVVLSGARNNGTFGTSTGSAGDLYVFPDGNIGIGFSKDGTAANLETTTVSLDRNKDNYIRNVLNTNPTLTNASISTDASRTSSLGGKFWVGESFANQIVKREETSIGVMVNVSHSAFSPSNGLHAVILPMVNQKDTTQDQHSFQFGATRASTGFYIGQDLSTNFGTYEAKNQQKLFRLEALTAGESVQKEIKISVEKIKAPRGNVKAYGSFSVVVRKITDKDNRQVVLERFDNLSLNPASPNYIAIRIGDKYEAYSEVDQANRQYGRFENRSKYVRVEMDADLDRGGLDARLLPFGVFGPLQYRNVTFISGSGLLPNARPGLKAHERYRSASMGTNNSMVAGGNPSEYGKMGGNSAATQQVISLSGTAGPGQAALANAVGLHYTGSIVFPSVPLRKQSAWGSPKTNENVYWGAWTGLSSTDTTYNTDTSDWLRVRNAAFTSVHTNPASTDFDVASSGSYRDGLLNMPQGESGSATTSPLAISWVFSLDDVSGSFVANSNIAQSGTYSYGNRANGQSISMHRASYTGTLDAGYDRFTTLLHGGFDGFDVTERDPFRLSNSTFEGVTKETESYQLETLKRAINIVSDSEQNQYNLISVPGVTQNAVTDFLVDTVEERGDALAIIDLQNVYTPDTESTASAAVRNNFTVQQVVDGLKDRNIDSSYAATYYPWVLVQDPVSNRLVYCPPSVAALGALSTTDRNAAPWYAPAGFARGGLSEGAAGIPVLDVSRRLTSSERDSLYDVGINPIAKFPAEGIVIFGQKTLQQTSSALDRINVRRLMIFLKREISFIASRLLFRANTQETWNAFLAQATPVLDSVKSQFGVDDFRLILDETTTTPDLVDRNIIYAKLLVKPTRTAEFFAIDFVVTNSGASFED
mgnify:CR=1 FL=1|tara:strand:+ start:14876 stop:18001 length:3126 start_codon:yes stop_codon:yes gene_type:complete